MRLSPFALLLAGLAIACVAPPDDDDVDGAATPPDEERLDAPAVRLGFVDPRFRSGTGDPDEPADDDDTEPEASWDASQPDVPDGTIAVFDVQCGLLVGDPRKAWVKAGALWDDVRTEGSDARPVPDLEVCFGEGDKFLRWGDDGFIYIEAGGLGHEVAPTETEDRWLGSVYPLFESSAECDGALAARGMAWPVAFGLRLAQLVAPE